MSAHNGFAHIILIGILAATLAIFGLVYLKSLQKTPYTNPTTEQTSPVTQFAVKKSEDTKDWKTYTNSKYKYSVKVPQSKKLLTTNLTTGDCTDATDAVNTLEITQNIPKYCGFLGEQLPSPESELAIVVLNSPVKDIYNVLGAADQKLTIAGVAAGKYIFTEKSELPNIQATRIYINHMGKTYLIFLKQSDKQGNYDQSFDQILSTFKFLN